MKKTLLALATTSALVVSGSALAAFADAPKGSGAGAGAQLTITGTLTNTNPNWMWQIPAASQAAVTDVGLKTISGVVNGNNTEFRITKNPMSILEGYMKTPSPNTGAGMTPVITVGSEVMSPTSKCTVGSGGCNTTIDAKKANSKVGDVVVGLKYSGAIAFYENNQNKFSSVGHDTTTRAMSVLQLQNDYTVTYPPATASPVGLNMSSLETYLGSGNREKVSSSRVVELVSAKLVVPTKAIPDTWAASLPITISLK